MSKTNAKPETLGIHELSASLAESFDLTKARSKALLDNLRDEIVENLLSGKRVNLFGLGTFEMRDTKAKAGRNPKTGATIQIPAGRKIMFKVSKRLKDQM